MPHADEARLMGDGKKKKGKKKRRNADVVLESSVALVAFFFLFFSKMRVASLPARPHLCSRALFSWLSLLVALLVGREGFGGGGRQGMDIGQDKTVMPPPSPNQYLSTHVCTHTHQKPRAGQDLKASNPSPTQPTLHTITTKFTACRDRMWWAPRMGMDNPPRSLNSSSRHRPFCYIQTNPTLFPPLLFFFCPSRPRSSFSPFCAERLSRAKA